MICSFTFWISPVPLISIFSFRETSFQFASYTTVCIYAFSSLLTATLASILILPPAPKTSATVESLVTLSITA